jgi:hypothetical protein
VLLSIHLVLLFGGGYYRYSKWGRDGGFGVVGTVLLILLVVHLVGALR